eukprot:3463698-Pleurochrysis_carterae.AAC.2
MVIADQALPLVALTANGSKLTLDFAFPCTHMQASSNFYTHMDMQACSQLPSRLKTCAVDPDLCRRGLPFQAHVRASAHTGACVVTPDTCARACACILISSSNVCALLANLCKFPGGPRLPFHFGLCLRFWDFVGVRGGAKREDAKIDLYAFYDLQEILFYTIDKLHVLAKVARTETLADRRRSACRDITPTSEADYPNLRDPEARRYIH